MEEIPPRRHEGHEGEEEGKDKEKSLDRIFWMESTFTRYPDARVKKFL